MQLLLHEGVAEVALVVLDHQRQVVEVASVVRERGAQLLHGADVLVDPVALAVDHQHDAVDLVQELLAGGRLLRGTGDGHQLDLGAHAGDLAQLDGQLLVVHGRVEGRRDGLHLAAVVPAAAS